MKNLISCIKTFLKLNNILKQCKDYNRDFKRKYTVSYIDALLSGFCQECLQGLQTAGAVSREPGRSGQLESLPPEGRGVPRPLPERR